VAKKLQQPKSAGFRSVPHTADAAFKLWGESVADIFVQGAQALYSLMTDRRRLQNRQVMVVEIEAPDQEALLVDWLNHLLYLNDTKSFFAKQIEILELSPRRLKARLAGEELNEERHILKTGVKAATYHNLAISRYQGGWEARIIFDL
jgi:SHS2 domain-containing protein